jgi:hypothetical protein
MGSPQVHAKHIQSKDSLDSLKATKEPSKPKLTNKQHSRRGATRAKTAVDYKKQLGRGDLTKPQASSNDKRFEKRIEIPEVSSLFHKVQSPRIGEYLSRDQTIFTANMHTAQYSPNYDFVRPKSTRTIEFAKFLSRKSLSREISNLEYNSTNLRAIKPDRSVPDFSKTTARPVEKILPCFMHSTCSRLAIGQVNHKALEMNYFAEGDLLASYSSFQLASPKSRNVKALVSPKGNRVRL